MARRGFLSSFIRKGYRILSVLNTANVVASGNPIKIAKHLSRKRAVGIASRIVPHSKGRRR